MGSQTQTQTNADTSEATGVLRLRGAHEPGPRRVVQWAESVVDNEGLGRKSSKGKFVFPCSKAVGMWADGRSACMGEKGRAPADTRLM